MPRADRAPQSAVGVAALIAPALHSITGIVERPQGGFSDIQLWLDYIAFLPMSRLLLGIHVVHEPRPGPDALLGALEL